MRTPKRRPRALPALTGLLCLVVLVPWLVCMGLITAVAAQREGEALLAQHGARAQQLTAQATLPWSEVDDWPISTNLRESSTGLLPQAEIWKVQAADAVFDAQGNCLGGSWEDLLSFEYLTQAEWYAQVESSGRCAWALLNRDSLTDWAQSNLEFGLFDADAQPLRLEGVLEGTRFTPRTIAFWSTRSQTPAWITFYDNPSALAPDTQTVTLYATNFHTCYAPENSPLTYRGVRYDSLAQLVQTLGPDLLDAAQTVQLWSGPNLLLVSVAPSDQGYLVSGVWASPWRQAAKELWWVYGLTLALCVGLMGAGRRVLRRELLSPIQQLSQALDSRQKWLMLRPSQVCRWEDGHALQEKFQAHGAQYREQQDEIQRLNTALTYAQTAEEHRRQLTSHIAHELKTPLAVIHSYVQGLQEHIAEDKREKYLATICSETEHMNDMVLELLDLSRLEAGKVKLRRETFSLSALTRSTVEKWEPALRAKGLCLTLALSDPAPVHADRGRMAQVVENLLTNAIKYTPAGGRVQVEVSAQQSQTTLSISNDCAPIPPEELSRLFDPFYRRDDAAPGAGTGLGLAIVKNIMELHAGRCSAQATPTGVAFTVTL